MKKLLITSVLAVSLLSGLTSAGVLSSLNKAKAQEPMTKKQAESILSSVQSSCETLSGKTKSSGRTLVMASLNYHKINEAKKIILEVYSKWDEKARNKLMEKYNMSNPKYKGCDETLPELAKELLAVRAQIKERVTGESLYDYLGHKLGRKSKHLKAGTRYTMDLSKLDLLVNSGIKWRDLPTGAEKKQRGTPATGTMTISNTGYYTHLSIKMLIPVVLDIDTDNGRSDGRSEKTYRATKAIVERLINVYGFVLTRENTGSGRGSPDLTDGNQRVSVEGNWSYGSVEIVFYQERNDYSKDEKALNDLLIAHVETSLNDKGYRTFNPDFDRKNKIRTTIK